MKLESSKIDVVNTLNMKILVKRDDLLESSFSGNKARKLQFFLENDNKNIEKLISYGSMQSNNMYSMSSLAKIKNWEYIYYTNREEEFINEHSNEGNLRESLKNGMKIISLNEDDYSIMKLKYEKENGIIDKTLIIREGAAQKNVMDYGFKKLANEIENYCYDNDINNLKVFVPSGTGGTALYLQKFLKFDVYTTNCVGDSEYLTKQFKELDEDSNNHPTILKTNKKYRYGKLYKENYEIIQQIKKDTKIQFEYMYDPKGFLSILENKKEFNNSTLMYIHCGGILGNEIMKKRYLKKYKDLNNEIENDISYNTHI